MSSKGNRFGISAAEIQVNPSARRNRETGPMAVAVAVREMDASAQ